jgi:hypothetical protein
MKYKLRLDIKTMKHKVNILTLILVQLMLIASSELKPILGFDFSGLSSIKSKLNLDKVVSTPMIPHRYTTTPFMEGWYTRITHGKERIAIIVGYYQNSASTKQGYAAILTAKDGKLDVDEAFSTDFEINQEDSGVFSSDFTVKIGDFAYLKKDYLSVKLPSGSVIEASFTKVSPWKPISLGLGPESIGVFMPFKAHWYVHSLNSTVNFNYSNPKLNLNMRGVASAHQEKNWGQAFPSGWIWSQGSTEDSKYQFAVAGGELDIANQRAYLLGIRTPTENYTFHPVHSITKVKRLSCSGKFKITALGVSKKAVIEVSAPIESFSSLSVPTDSGFKKGAVESFESYASVKIYGGPFKNTLIESFVIPKSALEFGGVYACNP